MSSPTNVLLVEVKEMPLKLRKELLSFNYLIKKIYMGDQKVLNSFPQSLVDTYPFAKRFSQLKNGSYKLKTFPKFPISSYDYVNQTHTIKTYSLPYRKDIPDMNSVFLDFTQSKFKDHLLI